MDGESFKCKNFAKIYTFLLGMFFFFTLVVPLFFVNKIIFILLIILFITNFRFKINVIAPVCITVIFLCGYLIGAMNGFDAKLALQFLFSTVILYLIFPITKVKIDISKLIKKVFIFVEIFTAIYVIYVLNNYKQYNWPINILKISRCFNFSIVNYIGQFIDRWGATAVGFRSFGQSSMIMIHLGSAPFSVIPIGLYALDLFNKDNKIKSLVLLIGAIILSFLSTSRALLIGDVFAIFFAFLYSNHSKELKISFIILGFFALVFSFLYLVNNTSVFSLSDEGNSIKIGHFEGYISQINVVNALIGNGLATFYYSPVYDGLLAHTEITLLDFIRYFGILSGLLIYFLFLFPDFRIPKKGFFYSYPFILFVLYLFMSLTNPVLFNSIGIIVILYYWTDYIYKKDECIGGVFYE